MTLVVQSNTKDDEKISIQNKIQKRIDTLIGDDTLPYYKSIFNNMIKTNLSNADILSEFISFEYNTQNVKLNTRLTHLKIICSFNKYLNYKDFEKISKDDIVEYLNSLRKSESVDPTHKSIGTYNTRQMILSKFFRWFYNVYVNKNTNVGYIDHKNWITPPCMLGIKQLPRKEKSPFKPSDLWTDDDNALFLKYCPEIRDRCYHAMACDTSARPHEILSLRISDIIFKIASTGIQYAEVHVKESKTKPRTVPLIFSIPYVKDWVNTHPQCNNPNAFLFISLADNNFGEKLNENALYKIYTRTYQKRFFQKLVRSDSDIPEVDKSFIRNLLTKPWTPYILRHSSLTSKSLILKESALRAHAGWTTSSKMTDVYIHYFGNESTKSLLEAYGIEKRCQEQQKLKTKNCNNCNEVNKPDSKFCVKCRMILNYGSYQEVIEKQKQKDEEITSIKRQLNSLQNNMKTILFSLTKMQDQNHLNQTAKLLYESGIINSC